MDKFNWFNLPSIAGNRRNEQSYWNRFRYWNDSTNRLGSFSSDAGTGVPFRRGILTSFFIKPKLKFVYYLRSPEEHVHQNLDFRWHPKIERSSSGDSETHFPMRRFIDIIVVNRGKTVARNCEVKAQRISSKGIGCQTLGTDLKSLVWDNGETKMNIPAKSGRAKFHLIFSQQNFTTEQLRSMTPQLCKEINEKMQLHTWVGTKMALENPEYAQPDGLCLGDFTVEVKVSTEDGFSSETSSFSIIVGEAWDSLQVHQNR
jgi:hypothetical protein